MAGSPIYIELLAQIGAGTPDPDIDWEDLETAWLSVTIDPKPIYLMGLAHTAFDVIAKSTNQPLPELMADAVALHVAKNAGYAGADNPDHWANFRLSTTFGVTPLQGVLVRMTDKWSRIQSLRRNASNERIGESILDTLRDLAAYALIAICLIREEMEMAA
jgi:hypothetical protein